VEREGGNDQLYYVYTPNGSLLYSVEAADNSRRDYHYDEMGNTLFLTDSAGAVIASYAYSPYGKLLGSTGSVDNPFTWQGQFGVMKEGDSGLYYMRARYYDSVSARFISRDPVKSIGPRSINPYQYAAGNPMINIDPLGLRDYPLWSPVRRFPQPLPGPVIFGGARLWEDRVYYYGENDLAIVPNYYRFLQLPRITQDTSMGPATVFFYTRPSGAAGGGVEVNGAIIIGVDGSVDLVCDRQGNVAVVFTSNYSVGPQIHIGIGGGPTGTSGVENVSELETHFFNAGSHSNAGGTIQTPVGGIDITKPVDLGNDNPRLCQPVTVDYRYGPSVGGGAGVIFAGQTFVSPSVNISDPPVQTFLRKPNFVNFVSIIIWELVVED